ncbi:MAG: ribonuclease H-like domain-containing protein [Bacteroidota bacterium]|nr:ribonuclease H-like domain-containing protein [Bacteroidota bacterium]
MASAQQILFLDVETVSQYSVFDGMDERGQGLWKHKIGFMAKRDDHVWTMDDFTKSYHEKAAIYAEFGKVIVISAGIITHTDDDVSTLRIKSFYGHDEKEVLEAFVFILNKNFSDPNTSVLCGHNIREFDIPYLCRRMTIHNIELPQLFNISGKKPWEVKFICDTLELWKFGDYKNYTSLDLLAYTLGIPSPKENLDGSKVGITYWEENDLEKIKAYCEKDVITVAQVYRRMQNQDLLTDEQVVITN